MTLPQFKRARSPESKRQRSEALVEAARSIALEGGVVSVTLTAVADRAGVHHSAVRRYFDSHKDVLLRLAAEGWNSWSDAVCDALRGRTVTPVEIAEVLATTLATDSLLCDLFANVPLHLERDVNVERVIEFKKTTGNALGSMADAIASATPALSDTDAFDVLTATNALAATLWQVAHPADAVAAAYQRDPSLAIIGVSDFAATLTHLLAATCIGLARK